MRAMVQRPSEKLASMRRTSPAKPAGKEPLQIRIPSDVKRRFKACAAMAGIEPNQLFVQIWEHYEKTAPHEHKKGGNP